VKLQGSCLSHWPLRASFSPALTCSSQTARICQVCPRMCYQTSRSTWRDVILRPPELRAMFLTLSLSAPPMAPSRFGCDISSNCPTPPSPNTAVRASAVAMFAANPQLCRRRGTRRQLPFSLIRHACLGQLRQRLSFPALLVSGVLD
jgi:hypothetical protein